MDKSSRTDKSSDQWHFQTTQQSSEFVRLTVHLEDDIFEDDLFVQTNKSSKVAPKFLLRRTYGNFARRTGMTSKRCDEIWEIFLGSQHGGRTKGKKPRKNKSKSKDDLTSLQFPLHAFYLLMAYETTASLCWTVVFVQTKACYICTCTRRPSWEVTESGLVPVFLRLNLIICQSSIRPVWMYVEHH